MQNRIKIDNFKVGTFNVRGLTSNIRREYLVKDLEQYKLDIVCLQETKIKDDLDMNIDHSRLINYKPSCVHYGLGFLISGKVNSNIVNMESVNDRICYIDIELEENRILTVINLYGPTQAKVNIDQECRDAFYHKLDELVKKKKDSKDKGIILIAGDLNSRVGSNDSDIKDSFHICIVVLHKTRSKFAHSTVYGHEIAVYSQHNYIHDFIKSVHEYERTCDQFSEKVK